MNLDFYNNRKVFITGHTGFKGSWLCKMLTDAGAIVTGYSLDAEETSLFRLCQLEDKLTSIIGDVRNLSNLQRAFNKAEPEVVIHMALSRLCGSLIKILLTRMK